MAEETQSLVKRVTSMDFHTWLAGLLNIPALAMQVVQIIKEKTSAGVSLPMLVMFLYIQCVFFRKGLQIKNGGMIWGMGGAICISIILIMLKFIYP